MLLSEFAANAELKYELSEAMSRRSVPHALIIQGERGCGKRTLAGIIAAYGVCTSEGERPCGVCPGCIKAAKGIHPDIITADGNTPGGLNIESVRNIRSSAYIKPNEAPNKVYLLFNCEKMLAAAQNAFLKVLEEPPPNVMFIMTVTAASSLLQTVRSRSRVMTLYPPSSGEAVRILQSRFEDKSPEVILRAAEDCGGNIGAAAELLEHGGAEEKNLAEEILRAIPLTTEYPLMVLAGQAVRDRAFAIGVVDDLCRLAAECVRYSYGAGEVSPAAAELGEKLSKKRLLALQKNIQQARDVLNYNVNLNLYGTWLCGVLRTN